MLSSEAPEWPPTNPEYLLTMDTCDDLIGAIGREPYIVSNGVPASASSFESS